MTHPEMSKDAAARAQNIRLVVFDFDGVFTDNAVFVFRDGSEAVRCFRGDGIGLRKLEALGIEALVLSTETDPIVSVRCRKLGISCIQGCDDKFAKLLDLASVRGLRAEQIAFVGNDVNDLKCLEFVGLPIVVADAHEDVVSAARFRTQARGGYGAVREVCDWLARVKTAELEQRIGDDRRAL